MWPNPTIFDQEKFIEKDIENDRYLQNQLRKA